MIDFMHRYIAHVFARCVYVYKEKEPYGLIHGPEIPKFWSWVLTVIALGRGHENK